MVATGEDLRQMKKKYLVSTTGTVRKVAAGLWRVAHSAIETEDLEQLLDLLDKDDQKDANKLLKQRKDHPITEYKGMWKKKPTGLNKMSRAQVKKNLQSFRDAWESITTRHADLSDERLDFETLAELRKLLEFYYTPAARLIAEDWLRDIK
jgi:hypothetical protein